MSGNVYARIAERYQVPPSDDEAVERFLLDVAPTLSREERESILAELREEDQAAAPPTEVAELPVEVPAFSIDEAPPISGASTLAKLVGELSAAVEKRVRDQLNVAISSAVFSMRGDWWESRIVYTDLRETVRSAVRRMMEAKVAVVAVRDQERLVGLLSEHDVITRVVAAGLDPDDTAVAAVMTRVDQDTGATPTP